MDRPKNAFLFDRKLMVFFSLPTPYAFSLCTPSAYSTLIRNFVTKSAVNIDKTIPSIKVIEKPLIVPLPIRYRTTAAINVVTLPSRIADSALLKPILIEDCTVLPVASSSLIRAKIITLASTAIPTDRMIPAIPGNVKVASNA